MGKRILVRRRGKAGLQWLAPKKGKIAPVSYPSIDKNLTLQATVAAIIHERGRAAPLAKLLLDDGRIFWVPAVAGLEQGSKIFIGPMAPPSNGNILPLSRIPEGTSICIVEAHYGDGGRYVRVAGSSAIVFSQSGDKTVIKFPSGRSLFVDSSARATVGIVAGGGRTEKPFLKAGNRLRYMRARGKAYPKVRGVAMAVVHHPFGGGRHQHPGKSTSTSRTTPPGRKVGHIAPKRTGRGRALRQEQQQQAK